MRIYTPQKHAPLPRECWSFKKRAVESNEHQQIHLMLDIYFVASSVLGAVLLTVFANAASGKLPGVLGRLGGIFTSGAVGMPHCGAEHFES